MRFSSKILNVLGAGLFGLCPLNASALDDGVAIYVEDDDSSLLYEGQIPPSLKTASNTYQSRLESAHARYMREWSHQPEFAVNLGDASRSAKFGDKGPRIARLRQRLGLPDNAVFDEAMAERVRLFRQMHGLSAGEDGLDHDDRIDAEVIKALNRGHAYYAQILKRNLDHAEQLPAYLGYRYVMVDLISQELHMVEGDNIVDTMTVVTGKSTSQTPAMAGLLRHAVLNPYWNVPADLVQKTYARRIINGGNAYLKRAGFEVVSDFGKDAEVFPANTIDWRAVERGDVVARLRQKPGPGNGMGKVKFMFPNGLGIYLHDTPSKNLFEQSSRLFSAGCVRVERPDDLGDWLFGGAMPLPSGPREEIAALPYPVPIYITYFTAQPEISGDVESGESGLRIEYRDDIYKRYTNTLAQFGG